jgi:ribosomal protein L18
MDKMTKKEMFERVIEIVKEAGVEDEAVLVGKLEHEIELISKKRTGLTKNQKANVELAERVFEVIAATDKEKGMTIAEIFDELKDVEGITSTNKVSALVKKLKDAGRVTRVDNGKDNVTFKIAE